MVVRKLRNVDGSGGVIIPKDDLRRDGLVDEDGEIKDVHIAIDRIDDGEYRLKKVETPSGY